MSWIKIPETDRQFPKWLKRENLVHNFTRVIWLNNVCECTVMCLEGLMPEEKHNCKHEDERDWRLVSDTGR